MNVTEIMTPDVRCVGPDSNLMEAANQMRQLDVGLLPVCDQDHLAGVITDRDIVLRATAAGWNPSETPVREAMSDGVFWVFGDQSVEDAAQLMEEKQVRRLPVLSREKQLIGIISLGDISVNSQTELGGTTLKEISQPD